MIDFVYETLSNLGFDHPLHPPVTHIPMGMIVGGFLFAFLGLKKEKFLQTAHYCYVLALIFILPTVVVGIMDWQYRFVGKWDNLILAKFIMAGTLTLLLCIAVWYGNKKEKKPTTLLALYGLCLLNTGGLGYVGGTLTYG